MCIKVNKIKHQTEFFNIVSDVKELQKSLRKVHHRMVLSNKLTRDDYLSFFILRFAETITKMREDILNNHKYIKEYLANIKTIEFIKKCDIAELDECVEYFFMERSRNTSKFELYKEFLGIRKNRREEIEYYLGEKKRCEQKKITY